MIALAVQTTTVQRSGVRKKYSNIVSVNSKTVNVSDLEDSAMERTLHEARCILGETGYTHDSWSTTMTIKDGKYNIGHNWVDNQVDVSIDLPDVNYSASSFHSNICKLRNHTTGSRLHGLLLHESLVRYPNHIYNDDDDDVRLTYKGIEYRLHTLAKVTSNDAKDNMVINTTGSVDRVPGSKSLIRHLLPVSELPEVNYVGVHDPDGNVTVEMPYKYYLKLPQAYHDGDTCVEGMAGLCSYGDVAVRFMRPGACGAIITAKIGSAEKLIGQFTGVKPMQRAYVFPAVTIEEWNHVVAVTEETMSIEINEMRANYVVPNTARKGTTVYVPLKVVDKGIRPKEAEHHLTGGLTTITSVPTNHLLIDQCCAKKPALNIHFSDMYGVLKYPVMHNEEKEKKCIDKIPPDDMGRKAAENVKPLKAHDNTTFSEHPCSEEQTRIVFMHKADELGDYWKTKVSPNYQPLSVEDAIWGNKSIPPVDLDTSTGTAFQMLFPGKTKKKQSLGE